MLPRPPRSTRTDTLVPHPTLFRSFPGVDVAAGPGLVMGDSIDLIEQLRREARLVAAHAEPGHQRMRVTGRQPRHLQRPVDAALADAGHDAARLYSRLRPGVLDALGDPLDMALIRQARHGRRSEERRVGTAGARTSRDRGWPDH